MADCDDLPNEFDLIVIGTGFPESCIAAAASRIGKTVLHIDSNDFYGGAWASFSLEGLNKFLDSGNNIEVRNSNYKWCVPETWEGDEIVGDAISTPPNVTQWNQTRLLSESKRFNLDLTAKILYSAGTLVKLLISSNICRYAEFRSIDCVCTIFKDNILNVPCSRSDVFNTKDLSIIEKRLLMKFLTICMTYGMDKCEEDASLYRDKTFLEYIRDHKLTDKIACCIMQAIAMCNHETPFVEGMERIKIFITSLGLYGNTPFLFPMYGCGEIPQCFCRLCAVYGGIYCLKRRIGEITIDAETNKATVLVDGNAIRGTHVISSFSHISPNLQEANVGIYGYGTLKNHLSRGIFISTSSLGGQELNSGGGGVNLMRLVEGSREAFLIQLSHHSGACPKGLYVFHITTHAMSNDPEIDLRPFAAQVFEGKPSAPKIIYCAYFIITASDTSSTRSNNVVSTPIFCTATPAYELDFDQSIQNAKNIFHKIYPDAEFLPRAPDADEIIVDGEDPSELNEGSLPEDLRQQLYALEVTTGQMEIETNGSGEHRRFRNSRTGSDGRENNGNPHREEMDGEW